MATLVGTVATFVGHLRGQDLDARKLLQEEQSRERAAKLEERKLKQRTSADYLPAVLGEHSMEKKRKVLEYILLTSDEDAAVKEFARRELQQLEAKEKVDERAHALRQELEVKNREQAELREELARARAGTAETTRRVEELEDREERAKEEARAVKEQLARLELVQSLDRVSDAEPPTRRGLRAALEFFVGDDADSALLKFSKSRRTAWSQGDLAAVVDHGHLYLGRHGESELFEVPVPMYEGLDRLRSVCGAGQVRRALSTWGAPTGDADHRQHHGRDYFGQWFSQAVDGVPRYVVTVQLDQDGAPTYQVAVFRSSVARAVATAMETGRPASDVPKFHMLVHEPREVERQPSDCPSTL